MQKQPDDDEIQMLRPFRGFCARRQVILLHNYNFNNASLSLSLRVQHLPKMPKNDADQIKFEVVVLEDDDVSLALVDYSIRHRVENLILGASSRKGLSR